VLTSSLSALPEVVGEAGVLVNPRDEDALAQGMLDLYRNSALRADLSRRGLARAATFSWQQCAQQTVAVYRQVAGHCH
jgi:glycosyltransferase involved in cell wall biosynthesis